MEQINNSMIEFLREIVNYVNLPVTILMIMVLLYWAMIIVGVFGFDSLDFDFDTDVDIDLDADIGIDANVGIDADLDVDGGVGTAPSTSFSGGSTTTGNDGALRAIFEYFYLGEVPIVIIGSFFMLYFWMATVITNHYFNMDQRLLPSLLWLTPNVIGSLIVMRYTMIPFAILFRKEPPENNTRDDMHGLVGVVKTSEVTETFGQMDVEKESGVEITLNVRTKSGQKLGKGDLAKILSYNQDTGTFLVELTKWENETND